MLNWMREIAANCLVGNALDGDDFHLGFDVGLPAEVKDILSGKKVIHSKTANEIESSVFMLDEHELAMG